MKMKNKCHSVLPRTKNVTCLVLEEWSINNISVSTVSALVAIIFISSPNIISAAWSRCLKEALGILVELVFLLLNVLIGVWCEWSLFVLGLCTVLVVLVNLVQFPGNQVSSVSLFDPWPTLGDTYGHLTVVKHLNGMVFSIDFRVQFHLLFVVFFFWVPYWKKLVTCKFLWNSWFTGQHRNMMF